MKILVLASGGDAPGTNKFLWDMFRKFKQDISFAHAGFVGLVEGQFFPLADVIDSGYEKCAGAVIKSSRLPQFKQPEVFQKGLANAKKFDVVIVLGGNGSQKGAKELAENGVNCIFVPTTIDNDVEGSAYSIGFSTAVNEAVYAVEHVMPSMQSMGYSCLFEVMGRKHNAIAQAVAKRVNADALVTEKVDYELLKDVISHKFISWQSACIIVRENIEKIDKIAEKLNKMLGTSIIKTHIVGHTQRGGTPTKEELAMAHKFAKKAIECIDKGEFQVNLLVDENNQVFVKKF